MDEPDPLNYVDAVGHALALAFERRDHLRRKRSSRRAVPVRSANSPICLCSTSPSGANHHMDVKDEAYARLYDLSAPTRRFLTPTPQSASYSPDRGDRFA